VLRIRRSDSFQIFSIFCKDFINILLCSSTVSQMPACVTVPFQVATHAGIKKVAVCWEEGGFFTKLGLPIAAKNATISEKNIVGLKVSYVDTNI
jgi:hypothetical protein